MPSGHQREEVSPMGWANDIQTSPMRKSDKWKQNAYTPQQAEEEAYENIFHCFVFYFAIYIMGVAHFVGFIAFRGNQTNQGGRKLYPREMGRDHRPDCNGNRAVCDQPGSHFYLKHFRKKAREIYSKSVILRNFGWAQMYFKLCDTRCRYYACGGSSIGRWTEEYGFI